MRIDKYTQKMQEALQAAQDIASQGNHPEVTNEHFLSALLDQGEGITRPLLEKIGANVDQTARTGCVRSWSGRPRIHGAAADLRLANELRNVLDSAEKEMSKLKDEFTSAEHYLLALAAEKNAAAKALKDFGVTRDKLMQGVAAGARLAACDGSKSGRQISDAGKIWTRSHRDGAPRQDRSRDRTRQRNSPRHAGAFAPDKK